MGKKSAYSKGFRKAKKEAKPAFSKKDIKILIIGAAVIVIALICVLWIPGLVEANNLNLMSIDSDGHVKGAQDNYLITNMSDSSSNPKYSHVATVEPADGYALDTTDYLTDENCRVIYYKPIEGDGPTYYTMVAKGNYDEMADKAVSNLSAYMNSIIDQSEVVTTVAGEHNVAYMWLTGTCTAYTDADGNDIEPTYDEDGNAIYPDQYEQMVYMYVESPYEGYSAMFCITLYNNDENTYSATPEECVNILLAAAENVTFTK